MGGSPIPNGLGPQTGEDNSSQGPPMKRKDKHVTVDEEVASNPSVPSTLGVGYLEDKWITRGQEMLPPEKQAIFEQKWQTMEIHELELFIERSGLIHVLANWILEARKSCNKYMELFWL